MDFSKSIGVNQDIVISSWASVYGQFDESTLIRSAFNDLDLLPQVCPDFDIAHTYISKREKKRLAPNTLLAMHALEKAWRRAGLSTKRNDLFSKKIHIRHPKIAIVAGSSLGMLDNIADEIVGKSSKFNSYSMSRLRGNSITAPLAIRFGLGGGDFSVSAASATGGQALWMAGHLIRSGVADQVIALCVDTLDSTVTHEALQAIGASASTAGSRPLTADRSGMRPMSASAAVILERAECAYERRCTPLARWSGGVVKNECYHMIAPEPSGTVLQEATRELLEKEQLVLSDIEWLSMHATGTKVWDAIEANAIKNLFGHDMPHISAFKRTFGHTMSVAGLLETAMLAEGLASGCLPTLPGDVDASFELQKTTHKKSRRAMSWSIGMGGSVVANLFEKI